MTNKERIVQILMDFVKAKSVHGNSRVALELYANELVKQGATFPVKCKECAYRTEDGFCYVDVEGASYKKTHDDGYCDKGST